MIRGKDFELIDRLDGKGVCIEIYNKKYTKSEVEMFLFEEKKQNLIKQRKDYLKETSDMYSHDWTLASQKIIDKRNCVLQEINDIENATKETINNYLTF